MIPDFTLIQQLEKALPAYVLTRRWFRAKALTISSLSVSHLIEADGFLILFLSIEYLQGGKDLYLLPITSVTTPNAEEATEDPIITFESPEGNPVAIYDAVFSPFFRTALFRALATAGTFSDEDGSLVAKSSFTFAPVEGILKSFVSRAEQSNTSIIYGQEYILKLFRKLESGINPDIEMGAFLTSRGFKNTPVTLATLEFQTANETFSAAILQQFVVNQGDAWKYTLASLEAFYRRAVDSDLDTREILGDYVNSAKLLGVRTAQMHAALASDSANSDFTPETFTETDAQTLAAEIETQARSSIDLLRNKLTNLAPVELQLAERVLNLEERIMQRFCALSIIRTSAKRIRYHGDYHLGQVLYTGSDFMIIDFEGEPARPLSERRTKALALRDVAGMLRSFQYAAYAGVPKDHPSYEKLAAEKLAACSAFWCEQVTTLYLEAYFTEADSPLFLPATQEQRQFFLDTFVLQKALYEVQYELNNRPAWVGIPLRGILSLIES